MDGTTEPILAILGHPIAGNPSQFAIERALHHMGLEWRVLSFDVSTEQIDVALEGLEVLGIRGVLIDASVSRAAAEWFQSRAGNDVASLPTIDCLYRGEDGKLTGSCEFGAWIQNATAAKHSGTAGEEDLSEQAPRSSPQANGSEGAEPDGGLGPDGRTNAGVTEDEHGAGAAGEGSKSPAGVDSGAPGGRWIWLEPVEDVEAIDWALPSCESIPFPPDPQQIAEAKCIVLPDGRELETEDWPANDGSTIIIDLSDGHPDRESLERLGYRFVDEVERRCATLAACLQRWTQQEPSFEIMRDAMEEYLGV